jgi:nucleotide-binding universal stress UspA family protein
MDRDRKRTRALAKEVGASSAVAALPAPGLVVKKVLVPIDFSEASLKALRYAVALAGRFGSSLCLVHVVEPASFLNDVRNVPLAVSDREAANQLHHKLVMVARKRIDPVTPVHPLVCIGKPFDEIVKAAKAFNADLIVISTHGRTGLKHVFMGSVAENVVRLAPCPVLVVREHEHDFVKRSETPGKPGASV